VPLCLLYEVGILVSRFVTPRSSEQEAASS
jgi:Sec-independent protein secretion pathway component TatC